jgi:hypothetical protein
MRPVVALLVGIAISVVGLIVVVSSELDIGGALLIVAGVIVALLGTRTAGDTSGSA